MQATDAVFYIAILVMSIVIHEVSHGFMAEYFGDKTARYAGRLTLNPLKHLDLFGSVLLPAILVISNTPFLFGWAKPIPVNFSRLNNPRRDMMLVGMAGPAVNVVLAVVASQLTRVPMPVDVYKFVEAAVFINLLLAAFNMIPIPPLDGSRLVMGLLPRQLAVPYSQLERYGILIVMVFIYMGVLDAVVLPIVEWEGRLLGVSFL